MHPSTEETGRARRLAHLGWALCECAADIEAGSMEKAAHRLSQAVGLKAATGDGPLPRLAVPAVDCLARRLIRGMVPAVADALIDPSDHVDRRCAMAARRSFFDLSPFPKAAVAVSNRVILEAMENEKNVHVIDFAGPAAQPCQWIQLLRDFKSRPEGPPHLRLTIVYDDEEFLATVSESLVDEADELDVPLQLHCVAAQIEALDFNDLHGVLGLKSGEARALVCTQQLHRLLAAAADDDGGGVARSFSAAGRHFNKQMANDDDESAYRSPATPLSFVSPPLTTPPPQFQMPPPALASFLAAARTTISPKVAVLVEQEASHNGVSFRKRFAEALHYYGAVYDSLDAAAAAYRRPDAERAEVERAVLAVEIRDVLLHEGARRRERHDRLHQWGFRMEVAGFRRVPLSYVAIREGDDMVRSVMYRPLMQDQGTADHLAQLGPILYACAAHVIEGSFEKTDICLRQIKRLASIVDGPLQRLSLITADSLARRLLCPIQGFAGALIHPSDYFEQPILQTARCNHAELSPYISTGFVTINRAILEAVEDEKVVHIIDLSCSTSHPRQWLNLLHDFHGRKGGPPEVRLTVVHDDKDFLATMRRLLSEEADMLNIPFQFNSVIGRLETLEFRNLRDTLNVKYGEAIAISCSLQMHRLLAVDDNLSYSGIGQLQKMANIARLKQMASSGYSPVSTLSPQCQTPKLLASFLNAIRALKPNIMLVMEQDADHNALLFCDRFVEALNYYAALFDSFHAVAAGNPRRADERTRVERMILGEEIKNILVCEGVHRHERHERLRQWATHMDRSGFEHVPLSFDAIRKARQNLMSFGLDERNGKVESDCLLLCWGSTHLYSISAWRPHQGSTSGSRDHMDVQPQAIKHLRSL
nr:unnamed protein product [Digitaria exilis]